MFVPCSIDQYRSIVAAAASGEVDRKDLDKHVGGDHIVFFSSCMYIHLLLLIFFQTLRHIRLGELLHEHSSDARLIVM